MKTDFLDRYIWEAEAHANELLELYSTEVRESYQAFLTSHWDDVALILLHPQKEVFVFLGEDPTPQMRRLEKLEPQKALLLWVQARHQALQATKALRLARDVAGTTERKYRKVVRHAAQAALPLQDPPELEDLLWLQLPD